MRKSENQKTKKKSFIGYKQKDMKREMFFNRKIKELNQIFNLKFVFFGKLQEVISEAAAFVLVIGFNLFIFVSVDNVNVSSILETIRRRTEEKKTNRCGYDRLQFIASE
jgi:hypothetical protein